MTCLLTHFFFFSFPRAEDQHLCEYPFPTFGPCPIPSYQYFNCICRQAGAIVAIVLAIIMFIVFIIFAVRYYFVRQRASKVTPARARASQLAISGPTNFQHVASAGRNAHLGSTSDKHAADVGVAEAGRWTPERQPSLRSQTDSARDDGVWASSESPYNRNQQKYAVDFGALESGLRDHVQTMRNTRTNFP